MHICKFERNISHCAVFFRPVELQRKKEWLSKSVTFIAVDSLWLNTVTQCHIKFEIRRASVDLWWQLGSRLCKTATVSVLHQSVDVASSYTSCCWKKNSTIYYRPVNHYEVMHSLETDLLFCLTKILHSMAKCD